MSVAGVSKRLRGGGNRRWWALAVLSAAQFIVILDGAIVNVAIPSIQKDLGFSEGSIQWVYNSYLITYGGLLMLGGRVADVFGRRRLFMIGATLLACASLAAGLTSSQGLLIGARAVMGVGAAIITPAALAIIFGLFPEGDERNKALGIWGALIGLGAAVGVLAGGVITDQLGWQWTFFINVPLGAAALIASPLLLPESRVPDRPRLDVLGATAITGALVVLVFAIVRAPDHGWISGQTLLLLVLAVVLLAAFALIELRAPSPLLRMSLLRNSALVGANAAVFLFTGGVFATIFVLTLYMQQGLGYSALKTGIAYVPLTGGIIITSTLAAKLVTKCGVKLILTLGLPCAVAGALLLGRVSAAGTYGNSLLAPMLLVAVALGFVGVSLSIAAFAGLDGDEFGVASGLFNTSQQVGASVGVAVLSAVAYARLRGLPGGPHHATRAQLAAAFGDAFAVAAIFFALAFVVIFALMRQHRLPSWRRVTPRRLRPSTSAAEPPTAPVRETIG